MSVKHDQTEAMTFADQVGVMQDGEIVQIGTPVELFERPQHTFVGHFIGSPGVNVLPATETGNKVTFEGHPHVLEGAVNGEGGVTQIGIRPEFVSVSMQGISARVRKVSDIG